MSSCNWASWAKEVGRLVVGSVWSLLVSPLGHQLGCAQVGGRVLLPYFAIGR